jgi:GTP-binding protein
MATSPVRKPTSKRNQTFSAKAVFARGISGSDTILGDPRPQYAFVGRSNVGKSSSINALLGKAGLARASAMPGKTIAINFFLVDDRYYVVDLPGYGFARMSGRGAEQMRKHIVWYLGAGEAHPKKVVLVLDAAVGITDFDRDLIELCARENHSLIILANKVDRFNQKERHAALRAIAEASGDMPVIPFSAKGGEGIPEARKAIFS